MANIHRKFIQSIYSIYTTQGKKTWIRPGENSFNNQTMGSCFSYGFLQNKIYTYIINLLKKIGIYFQDLMNALEEELSTILSLTLISMVLSEIHVSYMSSTSLEIRGDMENNDLILLLTLSMLPHKKYNTV